MRHEYTATINISISVQGTIKELEAIKDLVDKTVSHTINNEDFYIGLNQLKSLGYRE